MMTCLAVCAAMRPKCLDGVVQVEQVAVLLLLLVGAVGVLGAIEDLEQQLVAELGLEAVRLGVRLA